MPTGFFTLLYDKKAHFVQGYDNIAGIDVALSDVLAGDALSSWPETDEVALKDKRIRWCGLVETMQEKRGAGRSGEANKFWVSGRNHSGGGLFLNESREIGEIFEGERGVDGSTPHHVVAWSDRLRRRGCC
jgi:hypothetical protein